MNQSGTSDGGDSRLSRRVGKDAQRRGCSANAGTTGRSLKQGRLELLSELIVCDCCNATSVDAGLNGNVARVGVVGAE